MISRHRFNYCGLDLTLTVSNGVCSVASTDDTLDETVATAHDFPFDLSGTSTASTDFIMSDLREAMDTIARVIQVTLIEDYRLYKTIFRPYIVETYRRFSKPFWRGKNFKKRIK